VLIAARLPIHVRRRITANERNNKTHSSSLHRALLLARLFALQAAETQGPVKVFILAGQSNMEGQAVADLDGKDYNDGKGTLVQLLRDPAKAPLLGTFGTAKAAGPCATTCGCDTGARTGRCCAVR